MSFNLIKSWELAETQFNYVHNHSNSVSPFSETDVVVWFDLTIRAWQLDLIQPFGPSYCYNNIYFFNLSCFMDPESFPIHLSRQDGPTILYVISCFSSYLYQYLLFLLFPFLI